MKKERITMAELAKKFGTIHDKDYKTVYAMLRRLPILPDGKIKIIAKDMRNREFHKYATAYKTKDVLEAIKNIKHKKEHMKIFADKIVEYLNTII